MANSFLSPSIITKEALRTFVNSLAFGKNANRQYDAQFANSGASPSGKIGPQLTIRKPNRFSVSDGAIMQVQDVVEESTTFTVSTRKHVAMLVSTQDMTLTIDEFSKRYIQPAVESLANQVDYDGLALYKDVNNVVGTPGTTPATAAVLLSAQQKLDEFCCPRTARRVACVNPAAVAGLVNGLSGLFNNQSSIGKQNDTGELSNPVFGLNIQMDQNVNMHTCGSRVATTGSSVRANSTSGSNVIALTIGSGLTIKAGDVFTVAGVYAVNPQNKQSTGSLMQFVVLEDAQASGTSVDVTVYPTPVLTGAKQNVSRLPTQNDAVVWVGAANTSYPQNIVHHPDAFALVTADLEMPNDVWGAREVYEGISMRVVRQYNITNDVIPMRIDILYGWKTIYPEWACRLVG